MQRGEEMKIFAYERERLKQAGIPLWAFILNSFGNFSLMLTILLLANPSSIHRWIIISVCVVLIMIITAVYATYAPVWDLKKVKR